MNSPSEPDPPVLEGEWLPPEEAGECPPPGSAVAFLQRAAREGGAYLAALSKPPGPSSSN